MPNKNTPTFTGLILVSGEDRPGITEKLMSLLSEFSISILDIEQLVIRGRLILTVLIGLDESHACAIAADLESLEQEIGLDIAVDFAPELNDKAISSNLHVVIISDSLKPKSVAVVTAELSKINANITAIKRTCTNSLIAIEIDINCPDKSIKEVQRLLAEVAISHKIDLAVEQGRGMRSAKRLVMLDMDSTLITQEVIDLLAAKAGVAKEVSSITERAMAGEMDFAQSLNKRVSLLAGLSESTLLAVRNELTLTLGAEKLIQTLHLKGHKVGVVSGGFIDVIEPILKDLEIDFYQANKLQVLNGKLTGKIEGAIIDRSAKLEALITFARNEGVPMSQTVAIGDGANDLDMIQAAGLGIAFNAKPKIAAAAATTIRSSDLSSVLLLMGLSD
ncbi:MAG: phosphoserine phosphatase SerB [Actinomycetota bacterium]|nr:phosphoserine phosphatase SerB [Actinomycetota bacterium]